MAVRYERVVVDLDDRFSRPMAGMAASTALFRRNLDDADRKVGDFDSSTRRASPGIDRLSGRMRILADVASFLGPALVPVGAVGIPALAGLAAQFGFAAVAGGTAVLAFQGVGDALKAVNTAALDPTEAHLKAARLAMEQLTPAARDFVRELQSLMPTMQALRNTAAKGMFPGFTEGLESLETVLPRVNRIIANTSEALGEIASDAGAQLTTERWTEFFDFLGTNAPSALHDLAATAGSAAHALAELWMAFDPMNDTFSASLRDAADAFDEWASGLAGTQGFADFMDYVQTNGPRVAHAVGAIGNALVQIVEAAAPIGGPALEALTAFARVIARIADSDLGTPIFGALAALGLYNTALRTAGALNKQAFLNQPIIAGMRRQSAGLKTLRADWAAYTAVQNSAQGRAKATAAQMYAHAEASQRLGATMRSTAGSVAKGTAALGALAVVSTDVGQSLGITNTAMLGLAGTMAGPWGAAAGAAAGGILDLKATQDQATDALETFKSMQRRGVTDLDLYRAKVVEAREATQTFGNRLLGTIGPSTKADDALAEVQRRYRNVKAELAETAPLRRMAAQMRANREAARETASSFLDFSHNASNAKVSLNAWIRQMANQARALTEFGNNARKAADRGLREGLIKQLQKLGPEGALRLKQLANGSVTQIGRANHAFDLGRAATRNYTKGIDDAGQHSRTAGAKINAMRAEIARLKSKIVNVDAKGAAEARAKIAALRAEINALHDRAVTITTYRVTGASGTGSTRARVQAEGGTVEGQRYPYGDKVLTYLAPGEEVISNRYGQADRHRELLRAINANAYAGGGTVAPNVSVSPNVGVSMAGAQITAMFPGLGQVVGTIVDSKMAAHDDMTHMVRNAGG